MKTLQEISSGFHAAYNEQESRRDAIKAEAEKARQAALRYQQLAARKMGDYYKLYDKAGKGRQMGWTDGLLRPLLVEIEERTGWEFKKKDDLQTFGLRAECPVFIMGEGFNEHGFQKVNACITFTPRFDRNDDGTWEWELWYDTGEKTGEHYNPNSIGALNGFDKVTAHVESVEQIIEFLQKQMEE